MLNNNVDSLLTGITEPSKSTQPALTALRADLWVDVSAKRAMEKKGWDYRELELFHDCGDPKSRDCVCLNYTEGCGRCSECTKNRAFTRETGQRGERICKLATDTDFVRLDSFKIEYPRSLTRLRPEETSLTHISKQMLFMRRVFGYAVQKLNDERIAQEKLLSTRSRVMMIAEDPIEQVWGAMGAQAQAFVDTDLVHGRQQRLLKDQAIKEVYPLIVESTRSLRRIAAIRLAAVDHWKSLMGAHIVRIGRGMLGRIRHRNKRFEILRNFAALRIQSAYRGYYDRSYVIPVLLDKQRNRCASKIAMAWIRYSRGRTLRARVRARVWRLKKRACIRIQAFWRGFSVRKRLILLRAAAADAKAIYERERLARLKKARLRREMLKFKSAVVIQKVWRGCLGRRIAYQRRQAGVISNKRVRELADKFLTTGDLWGFLATINADYDRVEAEKNKEMVRAKAMIDQMIRLRQTNTTKMWSGWEQFKKGGVKKSALDNNGIKEGGVLSLPRESYDKAKSVYQDARSQSQSRGSDASSSIANQSQILISGAPNMEDPKMDEFGLQLELMRNFYNVSRSAGDDVASNDQKMNQEMIPKTFSLVPVSVPSTYDSTYTRQAKIQVAKKQEMDRQRVIVEEKQRKELEKSRRLRGDGNMPGSLPTKGIATGEKHYVRGKQIDSQASINEIIDPIGALSKLKSPTKSLSFKQYSLTPSNNNNNNNNNNNSVVGSPQMLSDHSFNLNSISLAFNATDSRPQKFEDERSTSFSTPPSSTRTSRNSTAFSEAGINAADESSRMKPLSNERVIKTKKAKEDPLPEIPSRTRVTSVDVKHHLSNDMPQLVNSFDKRVTNVLIMRGSKVGYGKWSKKGEVGTRSVLRRNSSDMASGFAGIDYQALHQPLDRYKSKPKKNSARPSTVPPKNMRTSVWRTPKPQSSRPGKTEEGNETNLMPVMDESSGQIVHARPSSAPSAAHSWRYGSIPFEQRPPEQRELILQRRQALQREAEEVKKGLFDKPYDDGFRLAEEREEARRRQREIIAFSVPLEKAVAKSVADSFVGALIDTASALVEHVAVTKRENERADRVNSTRDADETMRSSAHEAAASVLVDGARRFQSFSTEIEAGKSLLLLEDVYRMTSNIQQAVDIDNPLSPKGLPMSRMEKLQLEALSPRMKTSQTSVIKNRSSQNSDDDSFVVPPSRTMDMPGALASDGKLVSDAGYDTTKLAADIMQSMGVHGAVVNSKRSNIISSSTSSESLIASGLNLTPIAEETLHRLNYIGGDNNKEAGGFVSTPTFSPSLNEGKDEMEVSVRPIHEIKKVFDPVRTTSWNSGQVTSLPHLEQARSVFAEEAVLQAYGMGVPGVRSLLIDVRGLEGPMDMLVVHALLRCLPVPHAAIEEAKEQGVLTKEQYQQLRRISISTNNSESKSSSYVSGSAGGRQQTPKRKETTDEGVELMEAEGAGELAAQVMRELSPSLARVQWEKKLHEVAFPIIQNLKSKDIRFVGDLLKLDSKLLKAYKIPVPVIATIQRLLGVLLAALKVTIPSSVKALYQTPASGTKLRFPEGPRFENSALAKLPGRPMPGTSDDKDRLGDAAYEATAGSVAFKEKANNSLTSIPSYHFSGGSLKAPSIEETLMRPIMTAKAVSRAENGGAVYLAKAPSASNVIYREANLFSPFAGLGLKFASETPPHSSSFIRIDDSLELPVGFFIQDPDAEMSSQYVARRLVEKYEADHSYNQLLSPSSRVTDSEGNVMSPGTADTDTSSRSSVSGVSLLLAAKKKQRLPIDVRIANVTAVIETRFHHMCSVLSNYLNGMAPINTIDEPIDVSLLQCAFLLPLPSPRLAEMIDGRGGIERQEGTRNSSLAPYKVFVRSLCVLPPLSKILVHGLQKDEADVQNGQMDRFSEADIRHAVEAALEDLTMKSKAKTLIYERAKAAQIIAKPWITAMKESGFAKLAQVIRLPARELVAALRIGQLTRVPGGNATLFEQNCIRVANAIPVAGTAQILEQVIEHWLAGSPQVRMELFRRAQAQDKIGKSGLRMERDEIGHINNMTKAARRTYSSII